LIDDLTRAAADCIARYLREHPAAADTVEGVHLVWVGAEVPGASFETTLAALEWLVGAGLVACVPVGSRLLWRAPRGERG
jgi:hypothetical protein